MYPLMQNSTAVFQTCVQDVDWGQMEITGAGGYDVTVRVGCPGSVIIQPHVMILSPNDEVEWAALLQDTGTPVTTVIPTLQPGIHKLRLAQLTDPDFVGSCNVFVTWDLQSCTTAGDCPVLATRFGRSQCTGGACVRPP